MAFAIALKACERDYGDLFFRVKDEHCFILSCWLGICPLNDSKVVIDLLGIDYLQFICVDAD